MGTHDWLHEAIKMPIKPVKVNPTGRVMSLTRQGVSDRVWGMGARCSLRQYCITRLAGVGGDVYASVT